MVMVVVVLDIVYGNAIPTVTPSDGKEHRMDEDSMLRIVSISPSYAVLPFQDERKVGEEEIGVHDLNLVHIRDV